MKYKDYYKLLGLETSKVSIDEIKSAYRAAAKKYHPDLNVGDILAEERIKDINEAYRILSVPASKRKYDRIWNSRNNINNYHKIKGKNIFSMFLGDIEKESCKGREYRNRDKSEFGRCFLWIGKENFFKNCRRKNENFFSKNS